MWWENLSSLQQVSFVLAVASTAIMIIFIILMLIGMDGSDSFDGGVEVDFDADLDFDDIDASVDLYNDEPFVSISGLRILTIRGVLAFFSIGGWLVYALADSVRVWLALLLGVVAGAVAAVLLAYAMKAAMRLENSGNLSYQSAIGKTAVVYIRVPKEASGKGKIIFNHQGRMVEVDAMTNEANDILAKKEVKIIGLHDDTTLVVK